MNEGKIEHFKNNGRYFEAPMELPRSHEYPSVFLAGGITGCWNWQEYMAMDLLESTDLIVYNPRRKDFPIGNPDAAKQQISWEYHALMKANLISFWFASETIQPIVLLEFGRFMERQRQPILIGIHPDYPRKQDVEIQLNLSRPWVEPTYDIDDHIESVLLWMQAKQMGLD